MTKFITKVFLFSLFVFTILKLVKLSVPYYWGNELMIQKMNDLNRTDNLYNNYFLGSSKVYRHINPIRFDSLTNLSSYNLGSPSMFALERDYIIDNFTSQRCKDGDEFSIIVGNGQIVPIAEGNFHSIRSKYYMDFKRLKEGVQFFSGKNDNQQIYRHIISYLENKLCIGELREIFSYHLIETPKLNSAAIEQRGFYALDQEYINPNTRTIEFKNNFRKYAARKQRAPNLIKEEKTKFSKCTIQRYRLNKYQLKPYLYYDRAHLNSKGANNLTTRLGTQYNRHHQQ